MKSRIVWLFTAFLALTAAPAMATQPAGGVYVIVNAHQPAQFKDVSNALNKAGVDGLLIHLRWDKISDGIMHYQWKPLDDAIALATKANKRFEIGILTDGAMPSWVTDPSGLNAAHASFQNNATVGKGCGFLVIAPPYDPNYLAAFRDLIVKLSAHLHATGAYASLSMIKLSGITTTTDEMRLPALDTCVAAADDETLSTWKSLGYSPTKLRSAWDSMLHAYINNFPDKFFNIGFIGINAFPGIRGNGTIAATKDEREQLSATLARNLIADAGRLMPGHLAIGFDSLILGDTDASYATSLSEFFADATNAGARLGWQTNELLGAWPAPGAACNIDPATGDPVPCATSEDLRLMLFAGIYPNGKTNTPPDMQGIYLELFPQNVNQWPGAVKVADQNLLE